MVDCIFIQDYIIGYFFWDGVPIVEIPGVDSFLLVWISAKLISLLVLDQVEYDKSIIYVNQKSRTKRDGININ